MYRFAVVILLVLLAATPALAFDWGVFVTESLIRTDLWQTHEWYWATADSPICGNGVCVYEYNPLLAGSDKRSMRAYFVTASALADSMESTLWLTGLVAFQAVVTSNNNHWLDTMGLGSRWMLAYRLTW